MSQDQFGESTRRAFLGTAAVATTATAVTLAVLPTSETALAAASASDSGGTGRPPADQIKVAQAAASSNEPTKIEPPTADWKKPAAMAIPKEGYFKLEQGRYGPIFPRTPANYGFTIIGKDQAGKRRDRPRVRQDIRKAGGGHTGCSCTSKTALPPLGDFRRRLGAAFHVPGDF